MNPDEIKDAVDAAEKATKDLPPELKVKAFEMVLNHLLEGGGGGKPAPRAKAPTTTVEKPRSKAAAPSSITPIAVDLKGGKGGKSLRDFHKEKAPGSQLERVTVFTYYLNKMVKVDDVLPGHILSCYNDVGERKPKVLKQLFADVIADKAWLERGTKEGSVRVTVSGENLVEQDLPRKK